jgi:hypothetical protein
VRFQTQLSAEVPQDWSIEEEITLTAESGAANVIASSRPLQPDEPDDVESFAEVVGRDLQSSFPGYRELASEEIGLSGGRSGWLRRFETEPEPGRRITQVQTCDIRDGRVYLTTATAATRDFKHYQEALISVLTSIDIDPRVGIDPIDWASSRRPGVADAD